MLKAGVMENLRFYETNEGSPQGGVISPLLANVYMHTLDEWFHTRFHIIGTRGRQKLHRAGKLAFVRYIRYADDFTILMRCNEEQALKLKQELFTFVEEELEMVLSEEKTLITQATEGFDFLGVRTFVVPPRRDPNRRLPYQEPSAKSVRNYRRKVKELTGSNLDYLEPAERIRSLNNLIRGWANYHRWGNAKSTFGELGYWTTKRAYRMLRRCSPGLGERATYRKHFKSVAVCDNLQKWHRYSQWHTPSVELGDGYRLGLLPMGIISTASYWKYRGNKIPSAFPLIETLMDGNVRGTNFCTADQAVNECRVLQWRNENSETLYLLRRRDVFRRDDHTCTECGYHSQRKKGEVHDLECHHIDPDGGHAMENLRTVCIPCHQRLTAGQASRTEP
jgi:Zn ribbon nucleic-acid-binding protein